MRGSLLFSLVAGIGVSAFGAPVDAPQKTDIGKHDRRMVAEFAPVVTNGVKWLDGRTLPIEGRAFDDTQFYYDRLPAGVTSNVNAGVRDKLHETAGMQFRFRTDSKRLRMTWKPYWRHTGSAHFCPNGVSGIDVYRRKPGGTWRFVKTGFFSDADKGGSIELGWTPGDECLVNLPLYNGIRSFKLGIDEKATVSPAAPHLNSPDKPVVFYGTSITQGGCVSRAGMSFVNIVGRQLDVPVVNLGFSGSGHMEMEMCDYLARIDAACYVLDCVWNMDENLLRANYEKFARALRARRPNVPIVFAAPCETFGLTDVPDFLPSRERLVKAVYDKFVAEGWPRIFWLSAAEQMLPDSEGTCDGCHPSDYGMMQLAAAFGRKVSAALTKGDRPALKGVMSPARPMTDDDFATLKSWGARLIRYQMTEDFFRHGEMAGGFPAYCRWLDGKLDHLLAFVLPKARQNGMRVVVDLHVPPGGRAPDSLDWAIYSDPLSLERYLATWRHIAERLRGNADVIYAYDLLNEPVQDHRVATLDYLAAYDAAARIVRAIDPLTPVMVESLDWDAPETYAQMKPISDENAIYEVHMYRPQEFTHQGTGDGKTADRVWPDATQGWNRDFVRERLKAVRDFEAKHGVRVYVGEFSATSFSKGAEDYIADCIAVFDEYGWDWTYHAFREWPAWSVEHDPEAVGRVSGAFTPSRDNPRKRALLKGFLK